MSLSLPANFKNDIQGKDTALFPIVVIGNWDGDLAVDYVDWLKDSLIISTNSFLYSGSFLYGATLVEWNINTDPVLLNIPSLKESTDISTRRYKISSVNLDISNYKSKDGTRFSEKITDSLINREVRIYWWSPSTELIDPRLGLATPVANSAAFIYYGSIRRYTHDDEKVRLVVEDRSQATLHKDLPTVELGTGDEVPDKYKNKPIPMVYGHVDKSPLVISSSGVENQDGEYIFIPDAQIEGNNFEIIKHPYNVLGDTEESYLYIYKDDKYSSVLQEVTGGGVLSDVGTRYAYISNEQYDLSANKKYITVYNKYTSSTTGEYYEGTNPIAYNEAFVYYISYVQNDIVFTPLNNISFDGNWNGTTLSVNVIYPDVNSGGYTAGYTTIKWDGSVQPRESSELKLVWKFNPPPPSSVGEYYGYTKISGIFEYFSYLFSEGSEDNTSILVMYRDMASYPHPDPENPHVYPGESKQLFRKDAPPSSDNDIINIEDTSTERWKTTPINTASITATIHPGVTGEGIYDWNGHYAYCLAKMPFNMSDNYTVHFFMIDGFIESDFYANVNGRLVDPSATQVISSILQTELGVGDGTGQDVSPYDEWKYAFTVDKKINSKKLIEGIASASPYIPRFNNMGEFKFDVIPEGGGTADHTIKEAECIDFSFSRSKIEQVYTKIVFKYNWDYARGDFNDSVSVEIDDFIETGVDKYEYDYYGFTEPYLDIETGELIHPDSTLVIDDDRGKYIRSESGLSSTAQDFAKWYLMWSCNQHLKMKVKLPLKYMNLEIGDLVDFDYILGGVKPYGIDYTVGGQVNHQSYFTNFLITSTNKTLEWVEIECIQMHDLVGDIYGCTSENNCNYNEDANIHDDSQCLEVDCAGVCGGDAVIDCCNVCGGGAVCDDCGDCPGEGLEQDLCGVCMELNDPDWNLSCMDCCGDPDGDCYIGYCGECVLGHHPPEYNQDSCGVCDGNDDTCNPTVYLGEDYAVEPGSEVPIDLSGLNLNCGGYLGTGDTELPFEYPENSEVTNCWIWNVLLQCVDNSNGATNEIDFQGDWNPSHDGNVYFESENSWLTNEFWASFLNNTHIHAPEYYTVLQIKLKIQVVRRNGHHNNVSFEAEHTIAITVGEDTAPTANAGSNFEAYEFQTKQLNGSGSSDLEGDLTYKWEQWEFLEGQGQQGDEFSPFVTGGVAYGQATLSDSTVANPAFAMPEMPPTVMSTPIWFKLTVTDEGGATDSDFVEITNNAIENCRLGDMNYNFQWNEQDVDILYACVTAGTCDDDLWWACAGDVNGDGGYGLNDVIALGNCVTAGTCEEL